jgi:hypothetical protein
VAGSRRVLAPAAAMPEFGPSRFEGAGIQPALPQHPATVSVLRPNGSARTGCRNPRLYFVIQVKMKIRVAALTTITVKTPAPMCSPSSWSPGPTFGRLFHPTSISTSPTRSRHSWRRVSSYLPKNSPSSVRSVVDVRLLDEGAQKPSLRGQSPAPFGSWGNAILETSAPYIHSKPFKPRRRSGRKSSYSATGSSRPRRAGDLADGPPFAKADAGQPP